MEIPSDTPTHVEAFLNDCYEDGKAAGSWVFNPGTEEQARYVLQGIEDNDPEMLDSLPDPLWNGEWGDEPTYEQLARGAELSEDEADDYFAEALTAFSTGVEDEVTRSARALID